MSTLVIVHHSKVKRGAQTPVASQCEDYFHLSSQNGQETRAYFNESIWLQVKAAFPGVYIGRIVEFWIVYGLFAAFDYYKRLKNKQAELSRIESLNF